MIVRLLIQINARLEYVEPWHYNYSDNRVMESEPLVLEAFISLACGMK